MAEIKPQEMIKELRDNIKTKDALKAKLVLRHLKDVNKSWQSQLFSILVDGDVDFALEQFAIILEQQPELTATQPLVLEGFLSLLQKNPEHIVPYLLSERGDLIAVINAAGEQQLQEAVEPLLNICSVHQKEDVLQAAVAALGHIGDSAALPTLADYLYAANYELVMAAAGALGGIGTTEAMQKLLERMGTDNELDYLILSIFTQIQDETALNGLNMGLSSHDANIRIFAKEELVRIGEKAVPLLLSNLTKTDNDTIIHTLNVLGECGDAAAVEPIRTLLMKGPANANVRFAAYEALGMLPLRKGAYTLTAGLSDKEEHVAIAAARAIDRSFSPLLASGLKNLLSGNEKEAAHITKIIITSQADTIFESLVEDENFVRFGRGYMPELHPEVREHYAKLLIKLGKEDSPLHVKEEQEERVRPKIVAVDDSRMILNIYKATLHELGYEPVLFEFPAAAIEWLKREKPLAVLTDLNMPKITGVQLTFELRKLYSKQLLPIIMVTTQSEAQDHEAALDAGVSTVLAKPFTADSLGRALQKVLG